MPLKYEVIQEMWSEDSKINTADLTGANLDTPMLHNKYYVMYVKEALNLEKLKADMLKLERDKRSYYNGEMDSLELKERGWPPQPLKIIRQDIPNYVKSDDDVITMNLKIALQRETVEYLEEIIRQINNRGYQIKNILDYEKFKAGAF